ncbi:MAG TPA: hypothetical protein VJK49_03755 [Candidatus Limnocylindrales bacterium]|nr:hypothetical protein [Candidatus Limnocylindrales bacterium]
MSRRNQARRRRNYGRRQHEVRERRGDSAPELDGSPRADEWTMPDLADSHRQPDDDGYGSFAR